jgi:hypothetical protein
MGSSLLFTARDMGRPVPFEKPPWAYTFTEADLKTRGHGEITSGYWWIELGGDKLDTITDAEAIRDELVKSLYGIWDHIKNGGRHGAENFALTWMAFLPGKRESRRVEGAYILREQDLLGERVFEDAVAYGGWSMDCHIPGGLRAAQDEPTQFLGEFQAYTIPYRCLFSRAVDNLFLAGRAISVSHMAFSSTRVMGTCAVVGQAAGTAAALALAQNTTPHGLHAQGQVPRIQEALIRDDCWIPGFTGKGFRTDARVTASGAWTGCEPASVLDGWSRGEAGHTHQWAAAMEVGERPAWLRVSYDTPQPIEEIILRLDSNLNSEIMPSISQGVLSNQVEGMPPELARDFDVVARHGGAEVQRFEVRGNGRRFHRFALDGQSVDEIEVVVRATYGDTAARIFAVEAYPVGK